MYYTIVDVVCMKYLCILENQSLVNRSEEKLGFLLRHALRRAYLLSPGDSQTIKFNTLLASSLVIKNKSNIITLLTKIVVFLI